MVKNLQRYTARALNQQDELTIYKDGILARNPMKPEFVIEDALKKVGAHLTDGSNERTSKYSCWISHSKDINKVINNYSYSSNDFLHKRSNIAIIENYNDSLCSTKIKHITAEEFKRASIENVPKLNLDLSTKEKSLELYKLGMLMNFHGNKYSGLNCIPLNYAASSSELLSLNKIDKNNIKYVLDALMADIVYAISFCDNKSVDNIIDEVVDHKNDIMNCIDVMPALLFNFYKEIYYNKREIYDIVENCDIRNNDPLAIEYFIINVKKKFIKLILKQVFNIKQNDVKIVEDNHHLAVIGIPKNNEKIELFGEKVNLHKFEYSNYCTYISGAEDNIVAMINYEPMSLKKYDSNIYTRRDSYKSLNLIPVTHKIWQCRNRLNK